MSKKISKILVPYDGTKSSETALKSSLEIAQRYGSTIILLTCIPEKFTFGFFKTSSDKKILQKQKKQAKQRIKKIEKKLQRLKISVKSKIIKCDVVSHQIIEQAKKEKADLIVMSKTKLSTNAEKMYLESTVETVFKNTPCSLLYTL